jgi:hypothetical protein
MGELTILVSTFLTSPCFRAVCRCAQGTKSLVGDEGYNRLFKKDMKKLTKLKEQFALELVWFPVVVTVRGDLTTYDEPAKKFVRVTYLDPLGADTAKRQPGWLVDPSPTAKRDMSVTVACDERYAVDGKVVKLAIDRPGRDVFDDATLERRGHRWTSQDAVSLVVFVHCRLRSRRLTRPPTVPPAVPCAVRRRTRWRCSTRSRRSTSSTERPRRTTMRWLAAR